MGETGEPRGFHIDTGVYTTVQTEQRMTHEEWGSFTTTRRFPLMELLDPSTTGSTIMESIPAPSIDLEHDYDKEWAIKIKEKYFELARAAATRFLSSLTPDQSNTSLEQSGQTAADHLMSMAGARYGAERGIRDKTYLERIVNTFLEQGISDNTADEDKSVLEDFYQFQKNTYIEPLKKYLIDTALSFEHRATLEVEQFHDSKSGLLTEDGFQRHYTSVAEQFTAEKKSAFVLGVYFDIDNFKKLNDTVGHGNADEALRRIGAIVRTVLRKNDAGSRMGGDEFFMLISVQPHEVQMVIERLNGILRKPVAKIQGIDVYISGGAVVVDPRNTSFDDMQQQAEIAGFLSKTAQAQKHGIMLSNPEMHIAFQKQVATPEGFQKFVEQYSKQTFNRNMNEAETALQQAEQSGDTQAITLATSLIETVSAQKDQFSKSAELIIRLASLGVGTNSHLKKLLAGVTLPPKETEVETNI